MCVCVYMWVYRYIHGLKDGQEKSKAYTVLYAVKVVQKQMTCGPCFSFSVIQ